MLRTEDSRSVPIASTPLAQALYRKRLAENLGLVAAAAQIGVGLTTLWRMETRGHLPKMETLMKAAKWLDVPPSQLVEGDR